VSGRVRPSHGRASVGLRGRRFGGILVNTVNERFRRRPAPDPKSAAPLAYDALAAASRAADRPNDLYVGKDEIGLRRSSPKSGGRPATDRAA
jgi:hypothetical protein